MTDPSAGRDAVIEAMAEALGARYPAWSWSHIAWERLARLALDAALAVTIECEHCDGRGKTYHEGTPGPILRALGHPPDYDDGEWKPCPQHTPPRLALVDVLVESGRLEQTGWRAQAGFYENLHRIPDAACKEFGWDAVYRPVPPKTEERPDA